MNFIHFIHFSASRNRPIRGFIFQGEQVTKSIFDDAVCAISPDNDRSNFVFEEINDWENNFPDLFNDRVAHLAVCPFAILN